MASDGGPSAEGAVAILRLAGGLKRVERTGWLNNGVVDPESVSDHSHRMAVAALLASFPGSGVDATRAMQVALVHDLAESIVGDITPHQGVTDEDKHARERAAMEQFEAAVDGHPTGALLKELWQEYEAQETAEARFVKDLDKFEMVLTAHEYELEQGVELEEFFESVRGKLKTRQVRSWLAVLEKQRASPSFTPPPRAPSHAVKAAAAAATTATRSLPRSRVAMLAAGFIAGAAAATLLFARKQN